MPLEPKNRPGRPPPRGWRQRRWWRWTAAVIAAAALPKCLLCVAAYVALATGLASVGPELCGPVEGQDRAAAWAGAAGLGLVLAGSVWLIWKWRRPLSGKDRGDR